MDVSEDRMHHHTPTPRMERVTRALAWLSETREYREAGFALTLQAILAALLSVGAVAGLTYAAGQGLQALRHYEQRQSDIALAKSFQDRLQAEGGSSDSIFIPQTDVNGNDNSDAHELDLYAQDAQKNAHFWAYLWDSNARTITRYVYAGPNERCPQSRCKSSGVMANDVTMFNAARYTVDQTANLTPLVRKIVAASGQTPKPVWISYGYPKSTAAWSIQGGNYFVVANLVVSVSQNGNGTTTLLNDQQELTTGFTPSSGVQVSGSTYTPPPVNSPTVNGSSNLKFAYPGATTQVDGSSASFQVSEQNYHDWFEISNASGFSCGSFPGPYPQSGYAYGTVQPATGSSKVAPPQGLPYAYPNPNNDTNQNAPATMTFQPTSQGLCTASIMDVYGDTAAAVMQVMGALTLSTGASSANHSTPPLQVTIAAPGVGVTATFQASKAVDSDGLSLAIQDPNNCSQYASISPGASAFSSSNPVGTETVTVTLKGVQVYTPGCTFYVTDQYNEPSVAVTVVVDPTGVGGGSTCPYGGSPDASGNCPPKLTKLWAGTYHIICQYVNSTQCNGIYTDNIADINQQSSTVNDSRHQLTMWQIDVPQAGWVDLHVNGVDALAQYASGAYEKYSSSSTYTYIPPTLYHASGSAFANGPGQFVTNWGNSTWASTLQSKMSSDNWACYRRDYNSGVSQPSGWFWKVGPDNNGGYEADYCGSNPPNIQDPSVYSASYDYWISTQPGCVNNQYYNYSCGSFSSGASWPQYKLYWTENSAPDASGNNAYVDLYVNFPAAGTYHFVEDLPLNVITGGIYGTDGSPQEEYYNTQNGWVTYSDIAASLATPPPAPTPAPTCAPLQYQTDPNCNPPAPISDPGTGGTGGTGGGKVGPVLQ
jgi:hypothetical protein